MNLSKKRILVVTACAFFCTLIIIQLFVPVTKAAQDGSPAPNPPKVDRPPADIHIHSALAQAPLSIQEWAYHKTSDSLHPDNNEQQFMWLMNRARANPSQEGAWLANTGDSLVEYAIDVFNVDLALLQTEFNGYDAKPPAAFDVRLYNAARAHSLYLIANDEQSHTDQFRRIDDAGFDYTMAAGIVFSYTDYALFGHAAFNIDWGDDNGDGSGMQPGRGHRMAIMSVDDPDTANYEEYTNVGYAVVAESNAATEVGPLVTTGNFGYADTRQPDHYNRFLVGTVWQDHNANDQYDPGEGMAGITVMPDSGTFFAITANSGGYAFPIASSGTYQVTFSGNGIGITVARSVTVGDKSVLLDLKYTGTSGTEPQAASLAASDINESGASLNGTVYTNGNETEYYFQYGTTTAYGSTTGVETVTSDTTVTAVVSGLNENTTYHYRLVATNSLGTSYGSDQSFFTAASTSSGTTTTQPQSTSSSGGSGGGCFIEILAIGNLD